MRLSFKRRPPTRQHRRSAGECISTCELYSPQENGNKDEVFDSPTEEAECGQLGSLKDTEDTDKDCRKTEDKIANGDPDNMEDPEEEQKAERAESSKGLEVEPSEPCLAEQTEVNIKMEEGRELMSQEAHHRGQDGM